MGATIITNILRFVVLVLIQVLFLKNTGYYNLATPYLYILFILLLPFEIPNFLLFLLSFLIGLTVDVFSDTLGLNAAACSLLALVRVLFISVTVQKDGFDNEPEPRLGLMGFRWFFFYAVFLTFFHHLVLFSLEVFRFSDLPFILLRTLLSSLFTIVLILIAEFIFFRRKVR